MKPLFLQLEDEVDLTDTNNAEERLYCSPHCFPHKLPFTKPIERELPFSHLKIKHVSS